MTVNLILKIENYLQQYKLFNQPFDMKLIKINKMTYISYIIYKFIWFTLCQFIIAQLNFDSLIIIITVK